MSGLRFARLLAIASLVLFLCGLIFRAFFYSRMYLAPGEPYGIADIIEFLLGWALLGLLGLSTIFAAVLAVRGPKHNRVAAAWLAATVVVVLIVVGPLHTLAARVSTP